MTESNHIMLAERLYKFITFGTPLDLYTGFEKNIYSNAWLNGDSHKFPWLRGQFENR